IEDSFVSLYKSPPRRRSCIRTGQRRRMDIAAWLRCLGLEEYEPAFRDNAIDGAVLPRLTSDDLRDIGVAQVGHRRKLLDAIAALGVPAPGPTRSAVEATSPSPEASPAVAAAPSGGERRQITVMFCDLVGSTALSARLDPEDMREILGAYYRCCADLITQAGGFVARYMGDGVLAYFGYPQAHEHDAERAVRAGLGLVEAVPKLTTTAGAPLQVRVGIATGLVVVGNLFELNDLGTKDLKGIAGPTPAWAAVRASSVGSRFDALHTTSLAALVGREEESELLLRRWSTAKT